MTQKPQDMTQKQLIESVVAHIGLNGTVKEITQVVITFDGDEDMLNLLVRNAEKRTKWVGSNLLQDDCALLAITHALLEHDSKPTDALAPKINAFRYLKSLSDEKLLKSALTKYQQVPAILNIIGAATRGTALSATFNMAILDLASKAGSQTPSTLPESVPVNATPLKIKKPEGGTP